MNRLEKKLTVAIVLLIGLLVGLAVAQQKRQRDLEDLLHDYADLNAQAAESQPGEEGKATPASEPAEIPPAVRRAREAQPRVQNTILAGNYAAAREELKKLEEAASEAQPAVFRLQQGLTVRALFPPESQERKRAKALLTALVEKAKQGYDVAPVQAELNKMAEAAQRSDRKAALAAFARAEKALQKAAKIPGFQPSQAGAVQPASVRPFRPGGPLPLAPFPPEMMAAAAARLTPQQQAFLQKLQALAPQLMQLQQSGRDLGPVAELLEKAAKAAFANDLAQAERLLAQLRQAVGEVAAAGQSSSPLPGVSPPQAPLSPGAGKAGATQGGSLPLPLGGGPAAPAGWPGLLGRMDLTPMALAILDEVRGLSEEEYRKRRQELAQGLARLVQGALGGKPSSPTGAWPGVKPPVGPAAPGPAMPMPTGAESKTFELTAVNGVHVRLRSDGQIQSLQLGWAVPLRDNEPAGLLGRGPEGRVLLGGHFTRHGSQLTQQLTQEAANLDVTAVYAARPDGLSVRVRVTDRDATEQAGFLAFALPVDLAGWQWLAPGQAPQTIAAGQRYEVQVPAGGTRRVSLARSEPPQTWSLSSSGPARIAYTADGFLEVAFDWPQPEPGKLPQAEFALALTGQR